VYNISFENPGVPWLSFNSSTSGSEPELVYVVCNPGEKKLNGHLINFTDICYAFYHKWPYPYLKQDAQTAWKVIHPFIE
jgi:hypothetical protein